MLEAQRSGARKEARCRVDRGSEWTGGCQAWKLREDQGSFGGPFYTVGVLGGDSRFGRLVTEVDGPVGYRSLVRIPHHRGRR